MKYEGFDHGHDEQVAQDSTKEEIEQTTLEIVAAVLNSQEHRETLLPRRQGSDAKVRHAQHVVDRVKTTRRRAQRRTRPPCDKASQRRRSWTRHRVVNKSCEQHPRATRCWCMLSAVRARAWTDRALTDTSTTQTTVEPTMRIRERETGRGGSRRSFGQG